MLKRILLAACLLLASQSLAAQEFKPFFGVETGAKRIKLNEEDQKYDLIRHHQPHLGLSAGVMFNQYFGLEAGGHITNKRSKGMYRVANKALHLSLISSYPVLKSINLIGGLGGTHTTTVIENGFLIEVQKLLPRAMVGLELKATDNVALRTSFVWNNKFIRNGIRQNHSLMYNFGLFYYFN